MSLRHTGPHALNAMEMEYHCHPFGEGKLAAKRTVQPLPAAFETEKRLDYGVRTDDNPIYIAFCEYSYTNATDVIVPNTSEMWIIQKFTYDGNDRVTRIEVRRGAWDNRTSLFS